MDVDTWTHENDDPFSILLPMLGPLLSSSSAALEYMEKNSLEPSPKLDSPGGFSVDVSS